jgi:hypothetical protein
MDGLVTDGLRQMGFTDAGRAEERNILDSGVSTAFHFTLLRNHSSRTRRWI